MSIVRVDFNVDDTQPSLRMLLQRVGGAIVTAKEPLEVDLSDCQFLGPSAVVTLCGLRRSFDERGTSLTIRPPKLTRLLNYCQYSGLLADFSLGPEPQDHPESVTTPVRVFRDSIPTGAIEEVALLAKRTMQLSQVAEHDLNLVLSELIQNVLDHSKSPFGGLVSARAYRDQRDVRVAVADFGVGIRRSLAPRVAAPNDKEAIRLALREEVSGKTSGRNLGLGLSHLHAIVRLTKGRMVIYSYGGFLRYENDHDAFVSAKPGYPGTIAFVRLPMRESDTGTEAPVDIWA